MHDKNAYLRWLEKLLQRGMHGFLEVIHKTFSVDAPYQDDDFSDNPDFYQV